MIPWRVEGHDIAKASINQRGNVSSPQIQRPTLLCKIRSPIVNACDARLRAADVVHNGFDDMRCGDAVFTDVSDKRAPQVVECPRRDRTLIFGSRSDALIQIGFRPAPSAKAAPASAKH
jgi:hypothetical protein